MLKFKVNGFEYKVVFKHCKKWSNASLDPPFITREKQEKYTHTLCKVINLKDGNDAHSGMCEVSPNDQYIKKIGCKLSLTRAIKKFSRIERTHIWQQVFRQTNWNKW